MESVPPVLIDMLHGWLGVVATIDSASSRGAGFGTTGRQCLQPEGLPDQVTRLFNEQYGEDVVTYAKEYPKRAIARALLTSATRKILAIGGLILIHRLAPKVSALDLFPRHQKISAVFFSWVNPNAYKTAHALWKILEKYHILDLTPLLVKGGHIFLEVLSLKYKNRTLEKTRRLAERLNHMVQAFWWMRVSLLIVAELRTHASSYRKGIEGVVRLFPCTNSSLEGRQCMREVRALFFRSYALLTSLFAAYTAWSKYPLQREVLTLNQIILDIDSYSPKTGDETLNDITRKIDQTLANNGMYPSDSRILYQHLAKKVQKDPENRKNLSQSQMNVLERSSSTLKNFYRSISRERIF